VDGGIERVTEFWPCVSDRTYVLGRTARNRVLYEMPALRPARNRGPKPQYGPRTWPPGAWLRERKGWKKKRLVVRGRDVRRG